MPTRRDLTEPPARALDAARGGDVPTGRRGVEIPVVRLTIARTPDLGDDDRRPIRSHADAASVLAPFLGPRQVSCRLAAALVDQRQCLRAVALFDGERDSACCLRPSDLGEALIVAGAQAAWLAHRHSGRRIRVVRQDIDSTEGAQRLIAGMGLGVRDHLVVTANRYASLAEADAAHALWARLRRRLPAVPGRLHPLPPSAGRRVTAPRATLMRHVAFTLVGLRTLRHDVDGIHVPRRPHIASHADAAPLLAPLLDKSPWVAGLLDRESRLIAIARLDAARGRPCVVDGAGVYRAAVALGAAHVYLAHRHATGRAWPTDDDLRSAHEVYAAGFELGRELCDVLVFGRDEHHVSLRALGAGVPHWRGARDNADPDYPTGQLRWHQIQVNRRPMPRQTRHAEAARLALWQCLACHRRQNSTHRCRYCGVSRDDGAA